jgi:betaine lipid synthase
MGKGGDAVPAGTASALRRTFSLERLKSLGDVKDDILVLKQLWFGSKRGDSHAERLESFYANQAAKVRSVGRCALIQRYYSL